jgi:hypothetical protein
LLNFIVSTSGRSTGWWISTFLNCNSLAITWISWITS